MATVPYLLCKRGWYYTRIRIPAHLSSLLAQREIRWSLQTASLKIARKHQLIAMVIVTELFEQAAMLGAHDPLTEREKIWIKNRIEELKLEALAKLHHLLTQGEAGYAEAQEWLAAEKLQMDAYQAALDADHFDLMTIKGPASQVIPAVTRLGYDFSALNPNYNYLAKEFCLGMIRGHHQHAKILAGAEARQSGQNARSSRVIINNFHSPSALTQYPTAPAQAAPAAPALKLSAVVDEYLKDCETNGVLPKTIQEYRGVLTKLVDFTGNIEIKTLTRHHMREFREALQRYPARPTQAERKKGFHALIEANSSDCLGVASINKHISQVFQLLKWAEINDCGGNPKVAKRLQIKDTRSEREQRDSFSAEDLQRLFSTPNFQGQAPFAKSAYYWAPIIALFTGMRLEEICQLRTQDIYKDNESDLQVIDINDEGEDRKLKTNASRRKIPVHSKLVSLGLLDYVELMRSKRHHMLFPTLNRHAENGFSHAVGKWFSSHKKALGFDGKKTFHSFRHTVADGLRATNAEMHLAEAVLGHSTGSITYERYGQEQKPQTLASTIAALSFDIPAKPFKDCQLSTAEKRGLRSVKAATELRIKRKAAKTPTPEE